MERNREQILNEMLETDFADAKRLRRLSQELDEFETGILTMSEDLAYRVWAEAFIEGRVN